HKMMVCQPRGWHTIILCGDEKGPDPLGFQPSVSAQCPAAYRPTMVPFRKVLDREDFRFKGFKFDSFWIVALGL
ncbi:MAG: hypothetical protein AAFS10_17450, partial [Myxococcota bacterium]